MAAFIYIHSEFQSPETRAAPPEADLERTAKTDLHKGPTQVFIAVGFYGVCPQTLTPYRGS